MTARASWTISRTVLVRRSFRIVRVAVFVLVALLASSAAHASDYSDAHDDFHAHLDPSGFIACTTWPVEAWDHADCDGLNQDFESSVRAPLVARASILIGSGVYRESTWGFRAWVARATNEEPPRGEAEEAQYLEFVRAIPDVNRIGRNDVRSVVLGDVHAVRYAHDQGGEPRVSFVGFKIFGEHSVYTMEFMGPTARAGDLAVIADRAMQSVRVRPPATRSGVLGIAIVVLVGILAMLGTVALVASLARSRRRPSELGWPRA